MTPSTTSRLIGLDTARGLAVLGMLGAHTVGGSGPVVDAVVHGKPSVLFFLLAGVTIGLTATPRPSDDALASVRRRMKVFLRAGTVLGLGVLSLGVGLQSVLPVHAVLIALLGTLLLVRSRTLVVVGIVVVLVLPQVTVLSGSALEPGGALETAPAQLTGALAVLLPAGSYAAASITGLLLGRLLSAGRFRPAAVAGVGAGLALIAYGVSATTAALGASTPFLSAAGHSGSTIEITGSIGVALVVLAGVLALPAQASRLLSPIAAVGQCALTMYVVHFPLAIVALLVFGQSTGGVWAAFVVTAVFLAALSLLIRRSFRRGPLEWVVSTAADRLSAPVATGPATSVQ